MFVAVMQECIKVSHSGVTTGKECKRYTITLCTLSALTCSLRQVKLLAAYGWGSSDPLFILCVKSTFIQLCTQKSYSYNGKQPLLPSRNNTFVFVDHTVNQCFSTAAAR